MRLRPSETDMATLPLPSGAVGMRGLAATATPSSGLRPPCPEGKSVRCSPTGTFRTPLGDGPEEIQVPASLSGPGASAAAFVRRRPCPTHGQVACCPLGGPMGNAAAPATGRTVTAEDWGFQSATPCSPGGTGATRRVPQEPAMSAPGLGRVDGRYPSLGRARTCAEPPPAASSTQIVALQRVAKLPSIRPRHMFGAASDSSFKARSASGALTGRQQGSRVSRFRRDRGLRSLRGRRPSGRLGGCGCRWSARTAWARR